MASIENFYSVYISPSKGSNKISSWEDKIKENFGALSGYSVNLNNGENIDSILLDLLNIQPKGTNSYPNYLNIKNVYLEHIKSLQKDLEKEDNVLKKEINTLENESPSLETVNILKKYGILTGIEFFIPREKIYRHYDDFMGENVYRGGKSPYKDDWDGIISAKEYIPKNKEFRYYDVKLAVQVLVYSKVKFKLIDITNFISNVTTNNNIGTGGNFTIQMNLASQKEIDAEANFQDNNINITGYNKALFLQSIFRENDLVFIRFEKLDIEKDFDNDKKLKGRYWDMIGLIDNTSINSTYNNINITIVGRDLVKLFIEDYNFFIPIQFGNTSETIFGGGGTKIFDRLFTSGEYNLEFTKSFRSIENTIGFILSQLTNTQILSPSCIDLLKREYGNYLSKQFRYTQGGKSEDKKSIIDGIWGLVDYYVDEKITHYRLADASLKSPDGSVMQQIHKACQEPFVEIIADTFTKKEEDENLYSKYSLILRRPPFTIEDISKQKFIIVGKESTISEDLIFNQEVYTIFQLNPQGGCFINDNSIALSYLPMIVLDEYTKMWGNKLYSQTFNYINIDAYSQVEEENKQIVQGSKLKETFINSLIWLIEANAYLPFSRTGTITIRGDRRIKIGQWIYFEKSNEVFYVEGVQHTANINGGNVDRRTVLKVSRGLVKDYIIPAQKKENDSIKANLEGGINNAKFSFKKITEVNVSNVSYGDLVDIDYLREGLKELFIKLNKNFNIQKVKKNEKGEFEKIQSIVNNEVFNFFLSGVQFEGEIKPYVKNYSSQPAISLTTLNNLQKKNNYSYKLNKSLSDNNNLTNKEPVLSSELNSLKKKKVKRTGIEGNTYIFD